MDYKKILSLINEIKKISNYDKGKFNLNFRWSIVNNNKELKFKSNHDRIKFKDTIREIWQSDKKIYDTISEKRIEYEIFNLIVMSFENEIEIKIENVKNIFKSLLSLPNFEWTAFKQIYGITMNSVDPLQIGEFTIYNWNKHKKKLAQEYPKIKWEDNDNKHFIKVKVKARDKDRVKGLINNKFIQFENIITYMIGDIDHIYSDIAIFNYISPSYERTILVSDYCSSSIMELNRGVRDFDLEDNCFKSDEFGNQMIWEIAQKSNNSTSDIERRLLASIEWIGKGLKDLDDNKAFIQFIFAIEALLQLNDKGIVSPSIASQISEYAAFIIYDELENRIKIEKTIKNLYSKRSAIAHGRNQLISKKDLNSVLFIASVLVKKILTLPDFKDIKSFTDIQMWVKNKKYS